MVEFRHFVDISNNFRSRNQTEANSELDLKKRAKFLIENGTKVGLENGTRSFDIYANQNNT
jgi:hypothetical protein